MAEKNKEGRPPKTREEIAFEKQTILRKLEPYLKTGLSVSKALLEAKVSSHVYYDYWKNDDQFRENINAFRNFIPVLANNIITGELMSISQRQQGRKDKRGNPVPGSAKLTKEDKDFMWKFVLNSNLTKGEFGERKKIELFDPESEIQKLKGMLEDSTTEEVDHADE